LFFAGLAVCLIVGPVVTRQPLGTYALALPLAAAVGCAGVRTFRMGVVFSGRTCVVGNFFMTHTFDVAEIAGFEVGTWPGLVSPVAVLVTTAGRRIRVSAVAGPNPRIVRDDTRVIYAVRLLNDQLTQRSCL
jgi:hypothetical protein